MKRISLKIYDEEEKKVVYALTNVSLNNFKKIVKFIKKYIEVTNK